MLGSARRAVVVDHGRHAADERGRQLTRVADGRAAQHVAEARAVVGGDPLQPSQHIGDVRPEDPAISMHLVDDHEGQV